MALVTTGITGGPFSQPEWANAEEENPILSASFDMYNIIPDASENLDPKLVKVDVSLMLGNWLIRTFKEEDAYLNLFFLRIPLRICK